MKKRKLNDKETEICKKSIDRMYDKNLYLINYIIPMTQIEIQRLKLELKFGIKKKYEDAIKLSEKELTKAYEEINDNERQIKILKEQIGNGVNEAPAGVG